MITRYRDGYRGIKIKVLNSPVYAKLKHIDEMPPKLYSKIKYNKQVFNYKKIRDYHLFHDLSQEELDNRLVEDLFAEVKLLILNDVQIHILTQDNGEVLIALVDYGPLTYNRAKSLEFKSILDMYENLQDYELRPTDDDRISIITDNNLQAMSLDKDMIMVIFSELFDYRFADGGLMENGNPGGLIAKYDDQECHAGNEEIVLLAPDNRVMPYLRSFVNNTIFPYNSMVIVGGEMPEGFTKFNGPVHDLVQLMEERESIVWLPFIRLIEEVYNIYKFSDYFQELWSEFKDSLTQEQRKLLDFQFLINRINDSEVNLIASLDDYKKQAIEIGFSLFDNSIMTATAKMLPNRLWLPLSNNKETTMILSYLLISKPYDLVVINDTHLSKFINKEEIKTQFDLISNSCKIFISHLPEIWKNRIRVFIQPNAQNMSFLSRLDKDISVLSGNHLMLATGELISGIHYNHEAGNWNITEIQLEGELEETEVDEILEEEIEEKEPEEESEDEIFDKFYKLFGVDDYTYRANQNSPKFDHRIRLELIEHMSNSFEVLHMIKKALGRQINLSTVADRLRSTVEDLSVNGLISRVTISDEDEVIGLQERGELFLDKSEERILKVDEVKTYLDRMSSIREHAEEQGENTYLRTLIAFSQLVECHYHKMQHRQDHLLAAITHTWDDSIMDKADSFNKIFFASYYARLQELYAESNVVEEEKEIDLARMPTPTKEVLDITDDPLEKMETITIRRRKKASPYIPRTDKPEGIKADDTDWVKKFDTPTSDKVSEVKIDEETMSSIMVDDYIIMGATAELSLHDMEKLDIDNLKLGTRARNLLKEEGVKSILDLKQFDRSFVSIDGVGAKMNESLSGLRKGLRGIKDPQEMRTMLSDEGKKNYVLAGGEIDDMDHRYLRRVEDLKEINEIIDARETPLELVEAVLSWLMVKLDRPAENLEDMMSDLELIQERSNPLLLIGDKLVKLGFPYVYKKQDEFEESMDYKHVINDLRTHIRDQLENLVFPVVSVQSAESLLNKIEKSEVNADEKASFSTAGSVYQSNDVKSAYTLYYNTFEGYLRRVCQELEISPEFEDRDSYVSDLSRVLNKKFKLKLPVKPFEGELREVRNAIAHGNKMDERRIGSGIYELIKYIILSIGRISEIK